MISGTMVETIRSFVPNENVHVEEPMKGHTTFRIGGTAACLVEIQNAEQLRNVLHYFMQVEAPFFVLGNGSNVLVGDKGFRGFVLQIGQKMNGIQIEGDRITAKAGALMSQIANAALEAGLSGFEFASGIPGTIGGGVVMNAGAYGGELRQVVTRVEVMDKTGNILSLDNDTMEFGYRTSVIKRYPFIVTEVSIKLTKGNPDDIRKLMKELAEKRREKQPLEYPSAGSTFKRPEGYYAGELIMKAGLRGFRSGNAQVSEKHCGFVVNLGNAQAADVMDVVQEVRERVNSKFGVVLEPEIVLLGDF